MLLELHHGEPPQRLVQTSWWRHAGLDSQAADILPPLLQQRHQVVDGKHDVRNKLVFRHIHIAHSHTHTEHLLQLELDGRLDFGNLLRQIFAVRDWGGELAGCDCC